MTRTRLEDAVMEALLNGDHPLLVALQRQWRSMIVVDRTFTGVGVYTTFSTNGAADPVSGLPDRLILGDVHATISGLESGAGFVLYVIHGMIDTLEAYTYGESWPESVEEFQLSYASPDRSSVLSTLNAAAQSPDAGLRPAIVGEAPVPAPKIPGGHDRGADPVATLLAPLTRPD